MNFISEVQYLDIAVGGNILLGVFWWAYILTSRSRAEQIIDRGLVKAGDRGNR